MPYIKQEDRDKYNKFEELLKLTRIETKGDLEYLLFMLMTTYMKDRPSKYTELHDCVYAAQHCADEFRRRFLDERENFAREQNGDVCTDCNDVYHKKQEQTPVSNVKTKMCGKCKLQKDQGQFNKNAVTSDGLSFYCKDCSQRLWTV